mgnify:CR=1 FL=1
MKKQIIVGLSFLLFVTVSCNNESEDLFIQQNNEISTQVAELSEQYNVINDQNEWKPNKIYDESFVKQEGVDDDLPKIETLYPGDFKEELREQLENEFSKTNSYIRNKGRLVGVFKNGSCGSFKTLEVFMDCEDHKEQSYIEGFTGDSDIDSNGNVCLRFCVIDAAWFQQQSKYTYGVLRLSADLPTEMGSFIRKFDNEDDNCKNQVLLDGVEMSNRNKPWTYGWCKFGMNTELAFYFYEDSKFDAGPLPVLDISYGVLGRVPGKKQGKIFIDDEDSDNANYLYGRRWDYEKYAWTQDQYYEGYFLNLLIADRNTTLFVSKIN